MVRRRRVLGGALLAIACGAEPANRGSGYDGGGAADKADGAAFDPALSDHRNEVRACLSVAETARSDDRFDAETELLRCVSEANDAVWPDVQAALPESIPEALTGELAATPDDEVVIRVERHRGAQSTVCDLYASVYGGDDADLMDRVEVTCLAAAEVHTANLIDAYFDLGGNRLELRSTVERFERCEETFREEEREEKPETVGPPEPNGPSEDAQWLIWLHNDRRDCMKAEDAELRVTVATELGAAREYAAEDFQDRLRAVARGFERESRTAQTLCNLLSYQDEEEPELTGALCLADSTMQAGQLYDALRLVTEPADDEPADDEPAADPEPMPMPIPDQGEACYPGPAGNWDVCIPLVYPESELDGYDYAAALGGNQNYRRPIGFIDLDAVDPQTQITENFTLAEVAHRWKGRYAVVQPHAIASLQQLRDDVGSITVNSGYRSPKYNRGVGGATYSRHMYGDGFDMDPNAVGLSTLESACQNNGGFLVEYTSHVHCDFRFDTADASFFGEL